MTTEIQYHIDNVLEMRQHRVEVKRKGTMLFELHAFLEELKVGQERVDVEQVLQHELAIIQCTLEDFKLPADALKALIDWHVRVATDPKVNGGYKLVPVEPTEEFIDKAIDEYFKLEGTTKSHFGMDERSKSVVRQWLKAFVEVKEETYHDR